jgi:hypothetical protein
MDPTAMKLAVAQAAAKAGKPLDDGARSSAPRAIRSAL